MISAEESSSPKDWSCLRFKYSSVHELNTVTTLPVYDLSAVSDYILRFKYSSTPEIRKYLEQLNSAQGDILNCLRTLPASPAGGDTLSNVWPGGRALTSGSYCSDSLPER
jgi:hypothetical protein